MSDQGPSSTDLAAQLAAVTEDRRRIVEVTDRLNRDRLRDLAILQLRLDAVLAVLGEHPSTCLSVPQGQSDCECIVCRVRTAAKGWTCPACLGAMPAHQMSPPLRAEHEQHTKGSQP